MFKMTQSSHALCWLSAPHGDNCVLNVHESAPDNGKRHTTTPDVGIEIQAERCDRRIEYETLSLDLSVHLTIRHPP